MEPIKISNFGLLKSRIGNKFLDNDLMLIDDIIKASLPKDARRMNFIIIGLCTKGQVQYNIDTKDVTVHAGETIIISERHVIDNYRPSDDAEAMCMALSVDFFHEIIRNVSEMSALFLYSREHPVMAFNEKEQQTFKDYFQSISTRIVDTSNHFRKELIRTLMLAMFYDLSNVIYHTQQNSTRRPMRPDAIFTKFIKLVEENCRKERRVSWYAQQMCITPKYLSETIKQVSHRTPNDWIENYVTLEIRVLLKNTTKSIKEITKELNFPNQSFLGKYFKENVGMSPSEYRKT